MKRIASIFLLALLVVGLCASGAHAYASRGADCRECHSFSNQPPVANAGADQTVTAGVRVTLNGTGSRDSDDGIASYAWTQTPSATVTLTGANAATATFTAPNVTTQTTLTFRLTVTDRLPQSAADTCVITVRPAGTTPTNRAPVANAGSDVTVGPGARVTLNGAGSSDPDGGSLSYAWTQTPAATVALTNANTATASFTAPQVTAETSLTFSLRVTDGGGLSSTDTCIVRVSPSGGGSTTNAPPVASAGLDMMVLPGTLCNLDGFYSSDPDDGIASYAWTQTGGPSVTLSDPTAMDPIFQAPTSPGTLAFSLTVTDNGGRQSTDTSTVVVLSPDGASSPPPVEPPPTSVNQPPVARAGQDQTVPSSSTVRLSGSGSTDDRGIVSYQWRQTSGTSVRLSGSTSASASFTAPRVYSQSVRLTFQLTVRDSAGLSSSDSINVTVSSSSYDDEEDD